MISDLVGKLNKYIMKIVGNGKSKKFNRDQMKNKLVLCHYKCTKTNKRKTGQVNVIADIFIKTCPDFCDMHLSYILQLTEQL